MKTAKHIGHDVVAMGYTAEKHCTMDLLCTSDADEGAFLPSQHIHINGNEAIKALRDYCEELLGEKGGTV